MRQSNLTEPLFAAIAAGFLLGAVLIVTPAALGQASKPTTAPFAEAALKGKEAIRQFVAAHAQDGVFAIYDSRARKPVALRFAEIHETSHPIPSGETFYCADFKDADGTVYDLDFYLGERDGKPVVVESFIHKVGSKDRIRPAGDDKPSEKVAGQVRDAIAEGWRGKPVEIHDPRQDKDLKLDFDHVHESVKPLADGSYFACVDARDVEGVLYDLDVYVKPDADGNYGIVQTLIHKRDGVERLRAQPKQ
jgi:hypothetical protein